MRIVVAAFVLALLTLTAACAVPSEEAAAPWIGDERFTAQERAEILKGAAFLVASTGTAPVVIRWAAVPSEDRYHLIVRTPLNPNQLGSTTYARGIEIDPGQCDAPLLAWTAAHEIGHAVGLPHLADDARGLMNPVASGSPDLEWSEADEASCVRVGLCVR